jgi:hypothetical protein
MYKDPREQGSFIKRPLVHMLWQTALTQERAGAVKGQGTHDVNRGSELICAFETLSAQLEQPGAH